jgi:hypothetical protein
MVTEPLPTPMEYIEYSFALTKGYIGWTIGFDVLDEVDEAGGESVTTDRIFVKSVATGNPNPNPNPNHDPEPEPGPKDPKLLALA